MATRERMILWVVVFEFVILFVIPGCQSSKAPCVVEYDRNYISNLIDRLPLNPSSPFDGFNTPANRELVGLGPVAIPMLRDVVESNRNGLRGYAAVVVMDIFRHTYGFEYGMGFRSADDAAEWWVVFDQNGNLDDIASSLDYIASSRDDFASSRDYKASSRELLVSIQKWREWYRHHRDCGRFNSGELKVSGMEKGAG